MLAFGGRRLGPKKTTRSVPGGRVDSNWGSVKTPRGRFVCKERMTYLSTEDRTSLTMAKDGGIKLPPAHLGH